MDKASVNTGLSAASSVIFSSPILIVDDNEINRVFLERVLRANGFTQLLSLASAEEALEKIDAYAPDLIILDILMDGIDGFECCRIIRTKPEYRDLPVLVQTTLTEPELRVKAFDMGATDFISKPIYPQELCARVMVHLEKRHALTALQLYKRRVELELESARQLQLAIMPKVSVLLETRDYSGIDMAYHFQPSSEIGGDFWGMKALASHCVALWMVDFSGHGVASALNAFRLHAYLKEPSKLSADPGAYLSALNEKLLQLLMRGQFATMFYGVIDTWENQLSYSCACSPHPFIRRASGAVEQIDGSGFLLGTGREPYHTQSVPFYPGDSLFLYSDALTETPDEKGALLSEERIQQVLAQPGAASANEIKTMLLDTLTQHTSKPPSDDLTLIACKRIGA